MFESNRVCARARVCLCVCGGDLLTSAFSVRPEWGPNDMLIYVSGVGGRRVKQIYTIPMCNQRDERLRADTHTHTRTHTHTHTDTQNTETAMTHTVPGCI